MTKQVTKALIFHHRVAKRRTQVAQAERMGIHPVTLSKLENFHLMPGPDLCEALARETDRTPGEVFDEYLKHVRRVS